MKSGPAAFVLWLVCLVGVCGLHRIYLGRYWTGLLWLFTLGLLGIGQIVDLFLLPSMIRQTNMEQRLERIEGHRA
ncbi:NINE protein [Aquamicrobium sp. LC103]|uniref:NINE protein n=1 Tax=Aquamicrobium sp. LC103 TaxID=1120658 RepID=UPI00063E85B5|nr:NINE protein [Aquamicrobium sp. LC103]TKT75414.1 NINE protein [Aquamicrobium sp. LC103]